jgi:hypothetical protein
MFGDDGSHIICATHACIRTRLRSNSPCQTAFAAQTTLPYYKSSLLLLSLASVLRFSPVTLSAQPRLTSELLRTL